MANSLTEKQVQLQGQIMELCNLEDDELNGWETDFVERLSHQPVPTITSKQAEIIQMLYKRSIR